MAAESERIARHYRDQAERLDPRDDDGVDRLIDLDD